MILFDSSPRRSFLVALAGSVAAHAAALMWTGMEFASPPAPAQATVIEVTLAVSPASDNQIVERTRVTRTPVSQPVRAVPRKMPLDEPVIERAVEQPAVALSRVESEAAPRSPVTAQEAPAQPAAVPRERANEPDYVARYLYNPPPQYPWEARRMGIEGRVILHVEILQNGEAGRIEVKQSSGHDVLDQAALKAVSGWRFAPARVAGAAITAWADVPISFRLTDR
jgi:protein TonB